jgi:hypothetical protein
VGGRGLQVGSTRAREPRHGAPGHGTQGKPRLLAVEDNAALAPPGDVSPTPATSSRSSSSFYPTRGGGPGYWKILHSVQHQFLPGACPAPNYCRPITTTSSLCPDRRAERTVGRREPRTGRPALGALSARRRSQATSPPTRQNSGSTAGLLRVHEPSAQGLARNTRLAAACGEVRTVVAPLGGGSGGP